MQAEGSGESVFAKECVGVGVVDEDCDASELADAVAEGKLDGDADIEKVPVSHAVALRLPTADDDAV